jgi:glycosyltransferase involved in cell wall biosynthesis
MKILQVINSLATGGAEKLLIESVPKFIEKGIDIDVLLLDGRKQPFLDELSKQFSNNIFYLGQGSSYNPFLIFKIIPYLKRYDIIHVHLFPSLYWVAIAKIISFSKTTLIFTEHSTSNKRRKNIFYRMIDRIIYNRYSKVITISTEVKLMLKRHLGSYYNDYITINNGVDNDKIYRSSPADRIMYISNDNEKIIIQIARFSKQKDQETLIRSIPYVNIPMKLLLVGDGPEIDKMKELVVSLELNNKIEFLGIKTNVYNLLKMADLVVLSSNHEGLSLAGLEAMASGTPLIASKVSGLTTLVYDAGILFEHEDEVDLANKINEILINTKLYNETVNLCLKRAKKYSLDKMIHKHINLYKELCPDQN